MPNNLTMVAIFLFLLLWAREIFPATAQQRNNSTITLGSSLSTINSSYWSSSSGQFSFGFYPKGNGFAIGIWYNTRNQNRTIVWTANRDAPPLPSETRLLLSNDGRLILQQNQQAQGQPIVSLPSYATSASLLDNGNFVIYGSHSAIIWESFNFPTDTILRGQRLSAGHRLVSSISETDQSSGKFQLKMQTNGNLVQYPIDGPDGVDAPFGAYWNSSTSRAGNNVSLNLDSRGLLYLLNDSGINIKHLSGGNSNSSDDVLFCLQIGADGILRLYSRVLGDQNGVWEIMWSPPIGKCDPKGLCGINEYCSLINQEAVCNCIPGFVPIEPKKFGCRRNFRENGCSENVNYVVDEMENVIWEDNPYSILYNVSELDVCKENCSRDCNCEAALYKVQQCRLQKLPLRYGRIKGMNDPQEMKALIKMVSGNSQRTMGKEKEDQRVLLTILGVTFLITAFFVLAISGILIYKYRVNGYKALLNHGSANRVIDDVTLRSFTFSELTEATNGFMEELGKGAFGTVFKGVLPNIQTVVAVKRLDVALIESEREFENEMRIIGRTHHKNLVHLLGYCHEGSNRLLVYEYMSNGSLAHFLFKSFEERKLKWEERIGIVLDVARGIRYLHEDCKTQIIHCDIKPENILMDENGQAKIADFGLSKLLMPYQTRTSTKIRGTRGYVAPEWHKNLPVTVKADVYSFGIMLLEIICCRRSLKLDVPEDEVVLVDWAYECFKAGEVEKLVHDGEEVDKGNLERMIRVGLWCLQDKPPVRPLMKNVVLMLEGTIEVPTPPTPSSFLSELHFSTLSLSG